MTTVDGGPGVSIVGRPSGQLRGLVQGYLGYAERCSGVARQREAPTPSVVLIIGLGPALRVIDPRQGGTPADFRGGMVAGLHDGPVVTETVDGLAGVQVRLTPIGARRLLGVPMDEVANRTVDLEALLGDRGRSLVERVQEAPDWERRLRIVDDVLTARMGETAPPSPAIVWAWRQLTGSGGTLAVGPLATELGWSRRRLAETFREEIGLTPKVFARVVRFRRAVSLAERSPEPRWAEIALTCGYYDQAHLIRDVRRLAGCVPGALLDGSGP